MAGKQPKRRQRGGVDAYGRTALHNALVPLSGDVDLQAVSALLQGGADPNAQDDNGYSPLHFAAQESLPEAARLLVDAGGNPNLQDSSGNTPLFRAVISGHSIEVVRILLDAGADPFLQNSYERSAAAVAFESTAGDPKIAEYIRQAAELFRSIQR